MLYIPSVKTKNEYTRLKQASQPVKITKEITEMDKFVVDKYRTLKDIGLLGLSSIAAFGFIHGCLYKNLKYMPPLYKRIIGSSILMGLTFLCVWVSNKRVNNTLKDPIMKKNIYRKQGLNAII